jgi:hypothetical protein
MQGPAELCGAFPLSRVGALVFAVFLYTCCACCVGCGTPEHRASTLDAAASPVVHTTRRFTTRLVTLRTSQATVVTTPEHPFARVGTGWTAAIELRVGDRIATRSSHDATVVQVEVRDVSPTPVYNLTVAKTHSYFVSDRDLLVHNVNCFPWRNPPDRPAVPNPPDPQVLLERARERDRRARERLNAARLQREFNDVEGPGNCSGCTLASLGDFSNLSQFIEQHSNEANVKKSLSGLDNMKIWHLTGRLGLRSRATPMPYTFPPTTAAVSAARRAAASPVPPPFQHWEEVTRFMQEPTANTFAVTYDYHDNGEYGGHALVAVRQEDGTITYIDFQLRPPRIRDLRGRNIYTVTVIPTDIDWRFNRQLYRMVTTAR